jgi:hypothetical protein
LPEGLVISGGYTHIYNRYQLKKVYVNLFNENLSSIFSWFRTTLFHTFFVFHDFINRKEVKKRYFDRVSQNDLGFPSSNVNFLPDKDLLQMPRLVSRAERGGTAHIIDSYTFTS